MGEGTQSNDCLGKKKKFRLGKLVDQSSRINAEDQESYNWKVQEANTEDPSLKYGYGEFSNSYLETAGILRNL